MSRYDDDYDDNEDELDDDEKDDDEGVRRSTSNPFSSRPNSVRGAGLPQPRPPQTPQGGSGPVPSPIRSPGANPNLPNRPNNPAQGGSGNSGGNPNNSNNFPNRPNNPSQGGNSSTHSNSFPNRPNNPAQGGSGSSGGVQSYQRSSPIRGEEKNDDDNDRSAAVNRVLGSFGSKLDGKPDERPANSGFGARPGSSNDRLGDRGDDKSGIGGLTRNLGATPSRIGGDVKKEDKPAGGGLGGLTSRFGGGDKKDDKPAGGGLSSRFGGSGDKKEDKPAGGGLGGLTSRFGGGDKKDDKKDSKPAGGGLGGLSSRFGGGGDKKDAKPAGGGLGGLTSRFGGGDKKNDKPAVTSYGGARPGDSSGRQSPLGGTLSGGAKPQMSSSMPGSTSRSPFGSGSSSTPGKPIGNKKPAPSLGERLKAINPFVPRKDDRPAARKAPSKAPRVDQSGLSLDHKLDIIGIALLLGSLVLVLSSLSPTKGALTEAVNHNLSYVFGWGAIFVLGVTFAIGVWLILRHFGDEAPVISRTRLIGIAMLFLGALVAAQFIDSFQYKVGANQDYLTILKTVFLPIAYSLGRGGGWIGGEIYFQLLSNFGEIGGFMVVIGWLIVGVMLALSLSASDLAMIVISNVRNLSDALGQRRLRAAALNAEKQQALVTATQQISVSKPVDSALPLPATASAAALNAPPALPASTGEEQRRIPITTAGRTSNVPFRAAEMAEVAADAVGVPVAGLPIAGMSLAQPVPVAQEKSGGLFSRVRTVLPGVKSSDDAPVAKPAEKPLEAAEKAPTGGLRSRFFGGKQDTGVIPAVTAPTAAPVQAQTQSPIPDAQPTSQTIPLQPAAQIPVAQPNVSGEPLPMPEATAVVQPSVPLAAPVAAAAGQTPRLGDLLRRSPAAQGAAPTPTVAGQTPPAGGVQPYQRTPLTRPEAATPGDRKVPEAPQTPAAATAAPMPDLQSRLQSLRQANEAPKPVELTGAPVQMQPPARPAASSAFGRPDDPPFAVPQRSHPPAASSAPANGANGHGAGTPEVAPPQPPRRAARNWKVPDSAGLLTSGVDEEPDHEMLLKRAHIIEETLSSFGAPGRVIDVRTGPVVTQFGVEPDYVPGRGGKKNRVKVGAIAALDKDLQLALGAKAIRIEAPVPGKGYVGVEVPNEKAEVVHLRDVMESAEFKKIKSPLTIALGQGVDGTPVAGDLGSMPHLLIAGTTGSGKSVCVNSIISCLLLNNSPRVLKFVMVDPKRVELTQYNGVPHLIAPVVVELERIISVLKWVTREMDERYRKFSNAAARNIEDYNKHLPATEDPMPYIVVIIDELADLMMLAPDDTERTITRIAALARATGIHLVIATQRPSVDVVTGLIKANFPARVAFAVASNTDSRVILDQPGAERLLGRGDMLYMGGDTPAPVRLQGVWVSDTEIANITRFWRAQMSEEDMIAASRPIGASIDAGGSTRGESSFGGSRNTTPKAHSQEAFWDDDEDEAENDENDDGGDGEDEMYEQAVEMVRRLNKASVSLLQRRLRIGYTRAARLIDMMEERGIVGPATEGSKPREVLPVR